MQEGRCPTTPPGKLLAIMRYLESRPHAAALTASQEPALDWYHDSATVLLRAPQTATMDSMFTKEAADELRTMRLVTDACVATFVRSLSDFGFRVNADAKKRGVKALLCPGFYRRMDPAAADCLPSRRKAVVSKPHKRPRVGEQGATENADGVALLALQAPAAEPPDDEGSVKRSRASSVQALVAAAVQERFRVIEQNVSFCFQNVANVLQPLLSGVAVRYDEVSARLSSLDASHREMAGLWSGVQQACGALASTRSLQLQFDASFFDCE